MSILSQPLQNLLIKPRRQIGNLTSGPIYMQVVVSEHTTDTLTITKQPVQQGAAVTDHAYMEPTVFAHDIYFAAPGLNLGVSGFAGGSSLSQIYSQLLALQQSAAPIDIVTPKRTYKNFLIATLSQTTDKYTENCLSLHIGYQQIIQVPLSAATVPRINQKFPQTTAATQNNGAKSASLLTRLTGG